MQPAKYYRTVPGFPNVTVEFAEPPAKPAARGKPKLWAVLLLTGGVLLMFTETATIAAILFG